MSNLGFGVKLTSNSNVGVGIVSETADANLSVGLGGVRGLLPINVTPLLGGGGDTVTNLRDLADVVSVGLGTNTYKASLTFDATSGKFVFLSPDEIVDSAVSYAPVGLSTSTIDYLDETLDNKIDLDAGSFT